MRSNNPTWLPAILLSLWNQCSKSKVFLGNNVPAISSLFSPISDELGSLYQTVKNACFSGKAETTIEVYMHAQERFMAKLALGMGAVFLHPAFQNSPSADLLRGYFARSESEHG